MSTKGARVWNVTEYCNRIAQPVLQNPEPCLCGFTMLCNRSITKIRRKPPLPAYSLGEGWCLWLVVITDDFASPKSGSLEPRCAVTLVKALRDTKQKPPVACLELWLCVLKTAMFATSILCIMELKPVTKMHYCFKARQRKHKARGLYKALSFSTTCFGRLF